MSKPEADSIEQYCPKGHEITERHHYIRNGKKVCKWCICIRQSNWLFGGNREKAIARDGGKCIRCGMTREEHIAVYNKDITVDHIDHKGLTVHMKDRNNALENLQTLCQSCHSSKDGSEQFAKITAINAINIRHMKGSASHEKIAELYGVRQSIISAIIAGKQPYRLDIKLNVYIRENIPWMKLES